MAVKVRERPPGSGRWWIYTDWKGKRSARFIPQGKRAAEEAASKIATRLDLFTTTGSRASHFPFENWCWDNLTHPNQRS